MGATQFGVWCHFSSTSDSPAFIRYGISSTSDAPTFLRYGIAPWGRHDAAAVPPTVIQSRKTIQYFCNAAADPISVDTVEHEYSVPVATADCDSTRHLAWPCQQLFCGAYGTHSTPLCRRSSGQMAAPSRHGSRHIPCSTCTDFTNTWSHAAPR
jgi:hypothetical protein